MSAEQALSLLGMMLPILLATLLIGGAVIGSRLPLARRAWVERWLIWPSVIAFGLGGIVAGLTQKEMGLAISAVGATTAGLFYLRRNIKRRGADSAGTSSGTSA